MRKTRQSSRSAKPKGKSKKAPTHLPEVRAQMNVLEIIALHPDAGGILEAYGLNCHACAFSSTDTLESGARSHGLSDTDIENMVQDLCDVLKKAPSKPQELTLTESAAKALLEIAKGEGKTSCTLRVTSDESGGFCMEFAEQKEANDRVFSATDIPNATLIADEATLCRIGGSTVDFREGRFKLDLAGTESCGCEGNCSCG